MQRPRAGLAAALARTAEVRGGGADGGGDDDGGAKSGPRQISYKQERATHDQASARECHRPTQRRSQECRAARARRARRRGRATATGRHDQKPRGGGARARRARRRGRATATGRHDQKPRGGGARARRARRRGRATATGRHDQKPRGGGWGSRRGSPTTPQASHALMRRPADAARLIPVRCHAPLPPRRARRRRDAPAAAAAPARTAIRARASPRLPHATPYYPHDPPVHPASEPPCSIAGILPHSSPAGRLLISGRSGSSSSGGAASTIIISITASRRWRVQRGPELGCSHDGCTQAVQPRHGARAEHCPG